MRYELAHDSIARQILDRVSAEAKARRQAALLVERAYQRYQDRGVLLTQEDLDEIRPHEASIQFDEGELVFIQQSKWALQEAVRRKRQIITGIISVLSIFLMFSLWQWQRSVASSKALQASLLYENGYTSQAFRTARSAWTTLGADADTKETIEEVLQKIAQSGLERDLVHQQDVLNFDVDPEEKYLLSILQGNTAVLWDLKQRKQLLTLTHPDTLIGGSLIPWQGEAVIMTVSKHNHAYFWDAAGKLLFRKSLRGPIRGFDLSAKLKLALLWSDTDLMVLTDSTNIWPEALVPPMITNVDLAPNGEYLLVTSPDSVKNQWLLPYTMGATLPPEFTIREKIQGAEFVAGDAGNLKIMIRYDDATFQIVNEKGKVDTFTHYRFFPAEVADLTRVTGIPINRLQYSEPGDQKPKILFYTDSMSVYYWSAYRYDSNKQPIGNIDFYTRYDEPVSATVFSRQDDLILINSVDGRVDVWEDQGGTFKRRKRWRGLMQQAQFIDNDQQIISTAQDKTIKIWQLQVKDDQDIKGILHHYDTALQDF